VRFRGLPVSPLLGARALGAIAEAGVLKPVLRPDKLARMAASLRFGMGAAAGVSAAAVRDPHAVAVFDERGALTFGELDRRAGAIAAALHAEHGVGPDKPLAVMCRNHGGFVEAMTAASRLGADLLLLNTELPAPQLAQVFEREGRGVAVFDDEFTARFEEAGFRGARVIAWHDDGGDGATGGDATLDSLAASGAKPPRGFAPTRRPKVVILTSGTTGVPKGAPRQPSAGAVVGPIITLIQSMRLHTGEPMLVGPPVFHGFGLAFLGVSLFLRCPAVLARRFDPEETLAAIEQHEAASLVAVPVMLQRILELPDDVRRRYDTSSLRAVCSAGAPLSADLATAFMDEFGDVVFNLYGSTETGFAGLASPADLRAAPGTVGRAPHGVTVKILDDDRREVPAGTTGHVFIGGGMLFEGYSGGGSKEVFDGLMNSGDLGHVDSEGRLFIDGREDDMIVSGGENVFPLEVADVLARHEAVADVAVFGVEDEKFGQRLRAYVVKAGGSDPSEDELKDHVKTNLERYKVPRDVVFVEAIPRNPTGKILRRELPD
jgi:acyl-CoA synthetase (AMP-forming)/AMP-acid ligase II